MTFIRLSYYWYCCTIWESYFLLPRKYVFDMFVSIIAPEYHLCGQLFNNVKSDDVAATADFDKQVDDTANVDLSVFLVAKRVCDLYCLYTGPGSLLKYAFPYEASPGAGVAHECDPRCLSSIEPNLCVNIIIVLCQDVYGYGFLLSFHAHPWPLEDSAW